MSDTQRSQRVEGEGGWRGTLRSLPAGQEGHVEVTLEDGRRLFAPAALLQKRSDGTYYLPMRLEEAQQQERGQGVTIPVVREVVEVGRQAEETGRIVVHVTPQVRKEVIDVPLSEESATVERVPVNRVVSEPVPVRQDGDVTIVPVYEEVLVVERRLMLKEEVRITRRRTTRQERHEVALRTEQARVLRADERK